MFKSIKKQRGWLSFKSGGGRRSITLTILNTDVISAIYNIYTQAGSPSDVVDVTLTINSGGSLVPFGIRTGSTFAATSTIKIINHGRVAGQGGAGGFGAPVFSGSLGFAGQGSVGGDAIILDGISVTIDNTDGEIFGGGGGGGGGGSVAATSPPLDNSQAGEIGRAHV